MAISGSHGRKYGTSGVPRKTLHCKIELENYEALCRESGRHSLTSTVDRILRRVLRREGKSATCSANPAKNVRE